jgi:hypothetical protein
MDAKSRVSWLTCARVRETKPSLWGRLGRSDVRIRMGIV